MGHSRVGSERAVARGPVLLASLVVLLASSSACRAQDAEVDLREQFHQLVLEDKMDEAMKLVRAADPEAAVRAMDDPPPEVYERLERLYQTDMDKVRLRHLDQILSIVVEHAKLTGRVPLEDLVRDRGHPAMVVIGRNTDREVAFAQLEAISRPEAAVISSSSFDLALSEALGREIRLPRDPQQVPTYGPNVYIYLVHPPQFCVAVHLWAATEVSRPMEWEGGTFHSHAVCFERDGLAEETSQ